MKIGVPGEFHEDRWQRTGEESERRLIPRTREVGGTHRIQVIAWLSVLQIGLRYGHHAHKYPSGIPAERRGYLSGLRHGDPAYKHLSGRAAWRRGHLSALWHGYPSYKHLSGILAWRSVLLTGFRHGNPAYRHLSGIPAEQRGHLSGLRHGAPAHNHLSGIPAWRTASRPVHDRQLTDALTGLWHGTPGYRWF